MELPVKISYRGLEKSDQIDNLVLEYAARLEKFCDHINRCDVAIEQTNHTHHKGNPYRCRIDVTVARGHELVADERQIDNDPAVVRYRRDVKELSRSQLDDASIIECSRRGSGEHQSNVLNVAPNRAHARADVLAPLPPCFISGATNRYRAEMHQFEATFLHHANFVRRVKGFENNGYLVAAHA